VPQRRRDALRRRLERARVEGHLAGDPADVARFVMTVTDGIAVQAAGGTTREELLRVGCRTNEAICRSCVWRTMQTGHGLHNAYARVFRRKATSWTGETTGKEMLEFKAVRRG
jgi:hypothetical protein